MVLETEKPEMMQAGYRMLAGILLALAGFFVGWLWGHTAYAWALGVLGGAFLGSAGTRIGLLMKQGAVKL